MNASSDLDVECVRELHDGHAVHHLAGLSHRDHAPGPQVEQSFNLAPLGRRLYVLAVTVGLEPFGELFVVVLGLRLAPLEDQRAGE